MSAASRPAELDRLYELANAVCDGSITLAEQEELAGLVAADPTLRDRLVSYCQLHTSLSAKLGAEKLTSAVDRMIGAATQEDSLLPSVRSQSWLQWASRHPKGPAYVVAATVLISALVVMGLVPVKDWMAGGKKSESDETHQENDQDYVAKLSNWHDDNWLEDTRPPLDDPRLRVGRRLKIASGLIEVTYLTGTRVVIEGPAEFVIGNDKREMINDKRREQDVYHSAFSIHPSNAGFLRSGKLVARVEGEKAQGFTIDTPSARVEDLGTEFGVEVGPDGTQVHVISGRVRASFLSTDSQSEGPRTLLKDQSLRVATSGAVDDSLDTKTIESFVAMRNHKVWRSRPSIFGFAQRPSDDRIPLVHYKFDQGESAERLVNHGWAGLRLDATIENGAWTKGHTADESALSFSQPDSTVSVDIPGRYEKLTLATWVRVESFHGDLKSLLMSDGWDQLGQVHWMVVATKDPEAPHAGHVQFSALSNILNENDTVFSKARLEAGRWYHLAVVCDITTQTVELYVNGQLAERRASERSHPMIFGPSKIGTWRTNGRRLAGDMSDLMIFDRTLNGEEIKEIFRASIPDTVDDASTAQIEEQLKSARKFVKRYPGRRP